MAVLQIIGHRPRAGKTCLVGTLLALAKERGKQVSYYKPFSPSPQTDPDVAFFSLSAAGGLAGGAGPEVPPPWPMPQAASPGSALPTDLGQEIRAVMDRLEAAADLVLVEGPDLHLPHGEGSRLGPELASLLSSRVLLLLGYAKGLDAVTVANTGAPFGDGLAGVVLNGVPVYRRREVNNKLLSDLKSQGIPVLGALPEDRAMLSVTVQQIADHLGGSWVQEPVNTDAYVDRFLIGGNIMDSGPTYFGRFQNQVVVTRAERPDIQLASLMGATRCLVLTGGAQPTEYVKAEALQRDVPLILVQEDTLTTATALGGLLAQANPYSQQKVQRFAELARQHLDPAVLDAALH